MIVEALAAACVDREVLERLGGPLGDAAREAARALARLGSREARAQRAAWAATARAPVPPGLRGADPSWIEAGLAALPAAARDALARGGGDRVATWLVRRACAELPPLPTADRDAPPRSLDEAVRLRGAALAAWLTEVGTDQLALAIGAAGPGVPAALRDRLARAAARIARPPRHGALGPARAAIARSRGALDEHGAIVVGVRAIAPHVTALAARQLAVRLPRPLGLVVHAELVAHAGAPLDHAPRWAALAAPP